MHFSGSIAQSNQAIFPRRSSTQPLNSHSNLNKHGEVEANINPPVHEPQEPSSRTNVTNNADFKQYQARAATASIYASITIKFLYSNSTKRPKHSPKTVSSNNALRWFKFISPIHSQVEHAQQLNLVSPSRSPSLNALTNAPLAPKPPQAHIYVPDSPSPFQTPYPRISR